MTENNKNIPNDTNSMEDKGKRERVLKNIHKYYNNMIIAERIRDTPVDEKRMYRTYKSVRNRKIVEVKEYAGKDPIEVQEIYRKYNMTYFSSKQAFMSQKEMYDLSDAQKEALWIEWKHRDDLVRTGQYEELRIQIYRENYIKGMERLGLSQNEIEQVRNLTDLEFERLMIPNADKSNASRSRLPELGLFTYNDMDSLTRVRKGLEKVFKEELGKEFTYNEDNNEVQLKQRKLRRLTRVRDRENIDDTNEMTEYYSTIDIFPVTRIKKTKPDKYGRSYYYIPFLGSERTSSIVTDIVARKKKLKLLD